MEQLEFDIIKERVNYIVTTQGFSTGRQVTECETEAEAWEAIGKASFGALWGVTSPTGKNLSDFIPF